jgi:hypothetical protein
MRQQGYEADIITVRKRQSWNVGYAELLADSQIG